MKQLGIIAAPLEKKSLKILLFGAGELGKEIAIEAQRIGMEVIAVDRYERAPAGTGAAGCAQGVHCEHDGCKRDSLDCG